MSDSPQTVTTREKMFGITLGVGIGFLLLSLVFVANAMGLIYLALFTLGAALVIPLWLAGLMGSLLARRGYFRLVRWWGTALLVCIGWPSAIYLPVLVRVKHVHQIERTLPIYPNSDMVERVSTPFSNDNGPAEVRIRSRAPASRECVLGFYRTALIGQNWTITTLPAKWKYNRPDLYFGKGSLSIEVYVTGSPQEQSSNVLIICEFENANRDL
jgi:hypothetical protein